MTHEELRDRLLNLAYGELSPRDARAVEEHATGCEDCRTELARIRGTRQLMSALPVEPAPEAGARILVAAAREAVRGKEPRRALPRWLWATPVVAASAAVAVALSLRLGDVRPPSAARDDRDALLGASPYAQAPAPAAPLDAAAGAKGSGGEPGAGKSDAAGGAVAAEAGAARDASRAERPALAEKKAAAPRREEAQAQFATPPEDAAPGGNAAPERFAKAPAAPPPAALALRAPEPAPAPASEAPRQAAPAPAPAARPSDLGGPSTGLGGATQAPSAGASPKAKSTAAPARRAQANAPSPEASRDEVAPSAATSPRERAVAAARERAARILVRHERDVGRRRAGAGGVGPVVERASRGQRPGAGGARGEDVLGREVPAHRARGRRGPHRLRGGRHLPTAQRVPREVGSKRLLRCGGLWRNGSVW